MSSHDSDYEDDSNTELKQILRKSREEYEASIRHLHVDESEQIAEAMRLSLQSEADRQDEDDHLIKTIMKQSLEDSHNSDDIDEAVENSIMDMMITGDNDKDGYDDAIAEAIQQSLIESESQAAVGFTHSTRPPVPPRLTQEEIERQKMRCARLRALGAK